MKKIKIKKTDILDALKTLKTPKEDTQYYVDLGDRKECWFVLDICPYGNLEYRFVIEAMNNGYFHRVEFSETMLFDECLEEMKNAIENYDKLFKSGVPK